MQRFLLLKFYVVGVVAVVGLSVWGVAMSRTTADVGTIKTTEGAEAASTPITDPSPKDVQ
jgi:hypothetical protein